MDELSVLLDQPNSEVICEALFEWCRTSRSEPDPSLMTRAIALFNRGHNTPELLLKALQKDLLN